MLWTRGTELAGSIWTMRAGGGRKDPVSAEAMETEALPAERA